MLTVTAAYAQTAVAPTSPQNGAVITPAQTTAPAPEPSVGEVIVTAQRRAEPLQKTAASISVLTADTLQTAGVQNFADAAPLIPNFTFVEGVYPGEPIFSLRGVPTVQGADPPAAFVVDGVQAPTTEFVNQDLLDISNVQVLLGPQGGIYGRGAVGGAVIIETQQPTNQFRDTLTVDAGNGYSFRATNTASGPLIPDELWVKLTLEDHYFEGLLTNEYDHRTSDSIRDYAGRLEILAKPTTTTTLDLTYSHTQGTDGADSLEITPGHVVGHFDQYSIDYVFPDSDRRSIDSVSLKVDQRTPVGTLTSISQYAYYSSTQTGSATWEPVPLLEVLNPVTVQAVNEDLHLASSPDKPLQWIVGGFYQVRQTVNNLNVFVPPGGSPFCTTFGYAAGCPGGPVDPFEVDNDHNNSAAWAVYGQSSIPLPAKLKLNLALRYDSDTRSDSDLSIAPGPENGISHTFSAIQPSASLAEQFTPDVMGYVSVGRGFRSGGFNSYLDTFSRLLSVPREYAAETDLNYEVGFKSQFFSRHLTVNADYFHTDFNNEQYFTFDGSTDARDVVTIKQVYVNGGELAVTYIPIKGLTLGGSLGVADSHITSNDLGQNDEGKHSPQANLYTADLSALYRHPIWRDYNALYRVDYHYKGPICFDSANAYCFHSVGFLNARVGVENDRYTFALFAKNILGVQEPTLYLIGLTSNYQQPSEPATYGAEFIAHF